MKKLVTLVFFLCYFVNLFAQQQKPYLLVTDSLWSKELFKFPLHFAPKIAQEGFEDARFPKQWSNQESAEYWSYAFAWSIPLNEAVTEKLLEQNIQLYFDGLMNTVNKDKNFDVPKTTALFIKKPMEENMFVGKIKTYNAFHAKAELTLNVLAEIHFCQEGNKVVLLFRLSPFNFESEIWQQLKGLKLREDFCEI